MKKILITICIISLSSCSLVWHNRDYPIRQSIGSCPAENWPYIIDTLTAIALFSTASLFWSGAFEVPNREPYSSLLFITGVAFSVSVIGGTGEVIRCER